MLVTLAAMASSFASSHCDETMIDQIRASYQRACCQTMGVKLTVPERKAETLPALAKEIFVADTAKAERYKAKQAENVPRPSDITHRARNTGGET